MKKKIDGEKLRKEITKRGMSLQQASFEIGHGANYICCACNSNAIEEHALISLSSKFNIREEDITDKPQEPKNDLEETIYRAVLRALVESKMGVKS